MIDPSDPKHHIRDDYMTRIDAAVTACRPEPREEKLQYRRYALELAIQAGCRGTTSDLIDSAAEIAEFLENGR